MSVTALLIYPVSVMLLRFVLPMSMAIGILFFGFLLICSLYGGLLALAARLEVRRMPRTPFSVCDRCGLVPTKGGSVTLSAAESELGVPVTRCWSCFEKGFREAEERFVKAKRTAK